MYKAAEEYFEALQQNISKDELQNLKERLDLLSSEYSTNPAYCALLRQKYLEKKAKVEG